MEADRKYRLRMAFCSLSVKAEEAFDQQYLVVRGAIAIGEASDACWETQQLVRLAFEKQAADLAFADSYELTVRGEGNESRDVSG